MRVGTGCVLMVSTCDQCCLPVTVLWPLQGPLALGPALPFAEAAQATLGVLELSL